MCFFNGGSCFTRSIWIMLSCPMDHMSAKVLHDPKPKGTSDTDENRTRNQAAETNFSRNDVKDIPRPGPSTPGVNMKVNVVDWKAQELVSPNTPIDEDRSGEVNMEASITPDDVRRAGGFGAKDDISSFLPVASD
ncbi:hypothetical protein SADUNF_Sadunf16G0040400 [Salix dunnii]|uniref:Uncharacterized protein n=1 Tax=Salix dunnii TaxID=1413687 RepID=A0A835J7X8_9ROSI|nr:hypothetical protein SADUNF_Sadunf16G0040400 [Salix dunnii]